MNSIVETAGADALARLLERNEHVNVLLDRSTEALCSIAATIKLALTMQDPRPGCEQALAGSLAAVDVLREMSQKLTVSNQALAHEVREGIIAHHQFAAAVEQEKGARVASLHDRLTGLPNRALFNDRLEHGIARAIRHEGMLAVMFVDLDKFKCINDTYGHAAGDAVLKVIAGRLTETTRAEDTVSRHGGDEFLYLFTEVREPADCAKIAGKLLQAIQAPCTVNVGGQALVLNLDASVGIAIFPRDGVTAEVLVRSADGAMYRAKQSDMGYAFAH